MALSDMGGYWPVCSLWKSRNVLLSVVAASYVRMTHRGDDYRSDEARSPGGTL